MTPATYIRTAVDPALSCLPARMTDDSARAMLVAIAWQETGLRARRQTPRGPARSHLQFELSGLEGVLRHQSTAPTAAAFVHDLGYADLSPAELLAAMEFDGVLAAGMGRLNLYWWAKPLPDAGSREEGWSQYYQIWRPGYPRPQDWPESWARGWGAVRGG